MFQRRLIHTSALVMILFALVWSSAADVPQLDVDVMITLKAVMSTRDGPTGVLGVGSAAGVVVGGRRILYRASATEGSEPIGEAEFLDIAADSSVVWLFPRDGIEVVAGDLVELRLRLPRPEHDQIVWRLAVNAIGLTDADGMVLLDVADVFAAPDQDHDTRVIALCTEMLKELLPYLEDWELLDEILPAGRYTGLTMREVFEGAGPEGMRAFLQFVISYPGKYIAQTWKIEEIFATWVINDAPVSPLEILSEALSAEPDGRRTIIESHLAFLLEEDVLSEWHAEVWRQIRRGDLDAAAAAAEVMRVAAELGDQDRWWLLATDAAANVLDQRDDMDEAIAVWREGLDRTSPTEDLRPVALGNLADALRQVERWEEASAAYEEALTIYGALDDPPGEDQTAYAWLGLARVRKGQFRNADAAAAYDHAATVFGRRGGLNDVEQKARALSERGDVLAAVGRYREAVETWQRNLDVATELGWSSSVAAALDDMAEGWFNLGETDQAIAARREAARLHAENGDHYSLAVTNTNLASLVWGQGDVDEARGLTDAALASHLSREEWWDAGDVLERQGARERVRGNHREALALLERALTYYAHGDWPADVASASLETAESLEGLGHHARADSTYTVARARFVRAGDPAGEARVLEWWAMSILLRKGGNIGAAGHLDEAFVIRRRLGDLGGQSDVLRSLAYLAHIDGDYAGALAHADSAYALAMRMPSPAKAALALNVASAALFGAGRIDEAFARLAESLTVFEEVGDKVQICDTLARTGQLHEARGTLDRARAMYEQAVDVATAAGLDGSVADALRSLAWVLHVEGRNDEAEAKARRAMEIYDRLNNEWMSSGVLNTLASVAHLRGYFDEALELYGRSLAIDVDYQDNFGIAAAENNMGDVYRDMGDFETAISHYRRALELGERYGFVDVLTATSANMAHCSYELGDPDAALAYLDRGLAVARRVNVPPRIVDLMMIRGRVLRKMGRRESAAATLTEALTMARAMDKTVALIAIQHELGALAWEGGDHQLAIGRLEAAVATARALRVPTLVWEPLLYQARARRDSDDLVGAEADYRESMAALEAIRGSIGDQDTADAFRSNHDEVYRELVDLLTSQGRQEDAWQVLGLMKSQELRDLVGAPTTVNLGEADRRLVDEAEAITSREVRITRLLRQELERPEGERRAGLVANWQAEIDSLRLRFHDFVGELRRDRPDLYRRLEVEPVTFRQLQRGLQENEAFVEPVVLPDRLVIFVVRGGDVPLAYREVPVEEGRVYDLVRSMRDALENPDGAWERRGLHAAGGSMVHKDPAVPAKELHALLIEPILGDLDGVETVILSPSGRLRYIPFAALYDGERYLIDRFDLAVLTQAGTLSPREPIAADAALLAIGDPDGTLPGAVQEVHRLEELWSPARVTTILGADATKESLRREVESHGILHLATHGRLLNDRPEASYLLLAGGGEQSNLSMRDIVLLPLFDVSLAVLSACQTAVGENGEGSEIAGLAYNFEQTGASSVIASLWEVSDISTSQLMSNLYSNLRLDGISKSKALCDAQRALRNDETFAHPFHWAPFILIGNWR